MPDSQEYIPLSERVQQDVWHDNFVPKYSGLASARPSRLILIGVWLIFAPTALGAFVLGLSTAYDAPDMATAIIATIGPAFCFMLAAAILFSQTRRCRLAQHGRADAGEEDADDFPDDGVT